MKGVYLNPMDILHVKYERKNMAAKIMPGTTVAICFVC